MTKLLAKAVYAATILEVDFLWPAPEAMLQSRGVVIVSSLTTPRPLTLLLLLKLREDIEAAKEGLDDRMNR